MSGFTDEYRHLLCSVCYVDEGGSIAPDEVWGATADGEAVECHSCGETDYFVMSLTANEDCSECIAAYHEVEGSVQDCPCSDCVEARENKCETCGELDGCDCCEGCNNTEDLCTCYCAECGELNEDCECEAQPEEETPPTAVAAVLMATDIIDQRVLMASKLPGIILRGKNAPGNDLADWDKAAQDPTVIAGCWCSSCMIQREMWVKKQTEAFRKEQVKPPRIGFKEMVGPQPEQEYPTTPTEATPPIDLPSGARWGT